MAIQQPQTPSLQVIGRRLCVLLVSVTALLSACCDKDDPQPRIIPETADQTILFYVPGTSLYKYYQRNIAEITQVIGTNMMGNSRMFVCYQPNQQSKAIMEEIYYDPATRKSTRTQIAVYENFNAADAAQVSRLFADIGKTAPAKKYGLILGGHGKGWVPASKGLRSYGMFSEEVLWERIGDKETRAFGDSGYEINITELAQVLESQTFRFDYLIFDACFMANIEALYDLRRSVDYIVAAPCEVMAYGFPYTGVFPYLLTQGGTSYDLEGVCKAFYNFYEHDWNTTPGNAQSGCISLTNTSQLDALASVMHRINATPKVSFSHKLQSYEGLSSHLFFDLGHWVNSAYNDPALLNEFTVQFDKAFPKASRLHTDNFYSAYNGGENPITYYSGVSISEPSTKYTTENKATAWYQATH